ncbi:MAG: 3-phosphoshikimate 1-carboxyvinyltransferase, partial [Eubacterium sp.]|nr:3-phosphoshikimate 1-carboxyvinyltransferase [Eubacterium sp.]
EGMTTLNGICLNDDSRVFLEAIKTLGFDVSSPDKIKGSEDSKGCDNSNIGTASETLDSLVITGTGGVIPIKKCDVYVGSAGTAARFLTAMMGLSDGCYEVTSSEQMKARPMRELLEALEIMGAEFDFHEDKYSFPFAVRGRSFHKRDKSVDRKITADDATKSSPVSGMTSLDDTGIDTSSSPVQTVPLNIDRSSQFLSALLLCGPMVKDGFAIELTGTRTARSYVDITMRMMSDFGCPVKRDDLSESGDNLSQESIASMGKDAESDNTDKDRYIVPAGSTYTGRDYPIEPDVSSACYFYACAVLNCGKAIVRGVHADSMQGDIKFIELLKEKGFSVTDTTDGVLLDATSVRRENDTEILEDMTYKDDFHIPLQGFDINMSDFSDQTMTLACIAPMLSSPTTITGIAHIRGQESNRIAAIVTEMQRIGIRAEELPDGLKIYPIEQEAYDRLASGGSEKITIETYNDHRIAMSFAILGTVLPGLDIDNPGCCAKTFPDFFDKLNLFF